MKRKGFIFTIAVTFLILGTVLPSAAAITDGPDVAGLKTFQDLATGRIWLDLNNFFGKTFNEMISTATSAGFTVANGNDVSQLLTALPDPSANWLSYTSIMGKAPNRDLIWGGYLAYPGDTVNQWAYAYSSDMSWNFSGYGDNSVVENASWPQEQDLNIWAYKGGAPVPVPAALWLLGSGLVGLVGLRRKFGK